MNLVRKLTEKQGVLVWAIALSVGASALVLAHKSFANFNREYTITQAASIYVTDRGQKYFSQHELIKVLKNNGVDLSHGTLPKFAYDMDKPLDLNHLPAGLKAYQSTLNSMRGIFRDWLVGFNLNNPLFHVKIREAGYDLDGLDIGLRIDPELTASLGKNQVGVRVDVSIPHLRVHAKDICGYDSGNPILGNCQLYDAAFIPECRKQHPDEDKNWCSSSDEGQKALLELCQKHNPRNPGLCEKYSAGFGIFNPWVELRDGKPLNLSVPVRVEIQPGGLLQIEALSVSTNLEKLRFASGQERNLLLPTIQLQVGSQTTTVNSGPLVTELMGKEQQLVQLGLHHLQEFIVSELPGRLSAMAFDQLKQGFSTVESIDPPGIDTFKDGKAFEWGLRPSSLALKGDKLFFGLDGFVADPDLTWDEHLPVIAAPLDPILAGRSASDYDVALAINNAVIQRILWLAYTRGNLGPVDVTDSSDHCKVKQHAKIAASPILSSGTGGHAKMGVRLELERDGSLSEAWALKNPFQILLDLDIRAEMSSDPAYPNSFDLYLDHINTDTSVIDAQYIDHSADKAQKGLRDALNDTTCGSLSRKLTDTPIKVPADLFGLPIQLVQAEFDPHGYLVLYLSYGDRIE